MLWGYGVSGFRAWGLGAQPFSFEAQGAGLDTPSRSEQSALRLHWLLHCLLHGHRLRLWLGHPGLLRLQAVRPQREDGLGFRVQGLGFRV